MSHQEFTFAPGDPSSAADAPPTRLAETPCPMCNATGTLRRFARSDWFACAACRRTLLFADGGFARAGTVGEPWRTLAAAAVLCAAIGSSADAAPLMAREHRVLPIGHGDVRLCPGAR